MKNLYGFLLGAIALVGLFPASSFAVTSSSMLTYVDKYCTKMDPISGCGSYQGELTEARSKAMRIMNILNRYSDTKQDQLRNGLLKLLGQAYDDASGVKKFMAAYYYVFFAGLDDGSSLNLEKLFNMVLDDYDDEDDDYDYDYDDDYDDDDYEYEDDKTGEIVSVLSNDGDTHVNRSSKKITIDEDELSLRVLAEDNDSNDATAARGFRIVAMFENGKYEGDVYGANYKTNGYREFTFSSQFDDADSVTIYLICKDCDEGSSFNEGDVFEDRRVVDSEEYDLDFNGNNNDDDDDDDDNNDDDDNDLGIAEIVYSYDFVGNYVTVEVTTTVRNYGNEETMLDMLEYSVDVDDSNFSESNYDLTHIETNCDDSSIDDNEDEDIDIGEGDECEITVEFEFDGDDVEDERVEIEVMIESRDDEDSRNDTDVISFIPRD